MVAVGIDNIGKTVEKWHYGGGYRGIPRTLTIKDGEVIRIKKQRKF